MPSTTKSRVVVAPPASAEFIVINAALEQSLDLAWTAKNQRRLRRRVGATNFRTLEEISTFISNHEAWQVAATLSQAADQVGAQLSAHYPALSPRAIFNLMNQASYGWR
ncbi:MAG: hypothetical protein ABIZ04_06790 [Opitutus sp.]